MTMKKTEKTFIETLEQKKNRTSSGKKTGPVTGLVIQGGGMRGTYSMAALAALYKAGYGSCFDHVIGASAGAINGAYFLSGQPDMGLSVYVDDISNKKFIDFMRLKKIVDIDYLIDGVLTKHKLLDVNAVRKSRSLLHIIMTEFLTGKTSVVTNRMKDVNFMEALRASSAMQIFYNRVIDINGTGCIDGAVSDNLPVTRAIELGCTHILVILTRNPSYRRKAAGTVMRFIQSPFMKGYSDELKEQLFREDVLFNRNMAIAENPYIVAGQAEVLTVYPCDPDRMVSKTTSNRKKLIRCSEMAKADMLSALERAGKTQAGIKP